MKKIIGLCVFSVLIITLSFCEKKVDITKYDVYLQEGYKGDIPSNWNVVGYINPGAKNPVMIGCWCVVKCDGCGFSGGWYEMKYAQQCPGCGRDHASVPTCWFGWALFPDGGCGSPINY